MNTLAIPMNNFIFDADRSYNQTTANIRRACIDTNLTYASNANYHNQQKKPPRMTPRRASIAYFADEPTRRSSIAYFADEQSQKTDLAFDSNEIFRPEHVFEIDDREDKSIQYARDQRVERNTKPTQDSLTSISFPSSKNYTNKLFQPTRTTVRKDEDQPSKSSNKIGTSMSQFFDVFSTPTAPATDREQYQQHNHHQQQYQQQQQHHHQQCGPNLTPTLSPPKEHNTRKRKATDETPAPKKSFKLRFRSHQAQGWMEKYEELLDYRLANGHCLVPNQFPENPPLAEWVKRQRYQYKLKGLGKHSSMSDDRVVALEKLGFVWNSHDAVWEERLKELKQFKSIFGTTNVPSKYKQNPQLAIWVKRQRRQYKFLTEGKQSTMTPHRMEKLREIDFSWSGRKCKTSSV